MSVHGLDGRHVTTRETGGMGDAMRCSFTCLSRIPGHGAVQAVAGASIVEGREEDEGLHGTMVLEWMLSGGGKAGHSGDETGQRHREGGKSIDVDTVQEDILLSRENTLCSIVCPSTVRYSAVQYHRPSSDGDPGQRRKPFILLPTTALQLQHQLASATYPSLYLYTFTCQRQRQRELPWSLVHRQYRPAAPSSALDSWSWSWRLDSPGPQWEVVLLFLSYIRIRIPAAAV